MESEYADTSGVYGAWTTNVYEVESAMATLGHDFRPGDWRIKEHMSNSAYHKAWSACRVCGRNLVVWGDGSMTGSALDAYCPGRRDTP